MTTKSMLIIKDARGEIIGAQIEDPADSKVLTYITPAHKEHTLHRISDVPSEIHGIASPLEFQKAIADHLKSGKAKVTLTSAEELQTHYSPRGKKH